MSLRASYTHYESFLFTIFFSRRRRRRRRRCCFYCYCCYTCCWCCCCCCIRMRTFHFLSSFAFLLPLVIFPGYTSPIWAWWYYHCHSSFMVFVGVAYCCYCIVILIIFGVCFLYLNVYRLLLLCNGDAKNLLSISCDARTSTALPSPTLRDHRHHRHHLFYLLDMPVIFIFTSLHSSLLSHWFLWINTLTAPLSLKCYARHHRAHCARTF